MKLSFLLILITTSTSLAFASEQVIQLLQAEIEQASQERDRAQKALLHLQNETKTRIQTLSENQKDLNSELEKADHSILELQAEASRSSIAAQRAEQELAEREEELSSLREEIAISRAKIQKLEELPESVRNTMIYDEIKSRLGKQLIEISRAESKWKRALIDVDSLKELNQELGTSLQDSQRAESLSKAKLNALESRLGALNRQVDSLSKERDALVADQKRLNGVIRDLRTQLSDAERNRIPPEEMKAVTDALESARAENQQLLKELEQRRAIPDLREAYAALERERDALQAKQTSLTARIATLEQTLQKEQDIRKAEEELRRGLEMALAKERNQRETLEQETRTNNQRLAKVLGTREEPPDLQEALAKLERERNLLQAKQKALNAQMNTLAQSLRDERDGRRDEQELRRGLEVELGRERRERNELKKEIRKLQAGLDAALTAGVEQSDLAEVAMLLTELREENEELKNQSLESREDVDRLMSELNDTDSRQKTQIRELQTMLGEQMIKLTDAQRKIEALEARTVSYEAVKEQRDDLIRIRDKSRNDMNVLAKHIYELRAQAAKSKTMESQLQTTTEDRKRLRQEIEKQERLAASLRAEQKRKDQQILDLRKRLATEQEEESKAEQSEPQ